jgi:Flp pilus assembly protein TadD
LLYLDQKNKFRTERLKANAFAAEAYNKMGTILMRLGFIVEARQHFARAIVLKPDYAQARRNLNQAIREANASN